VFELGQSGGGTAQTESKGGPIKGGDIPVALPGSTAVAKPSFTSKIPFWKSRQESFYSVNNAVHFENKSLAHLQEQ
jgi:hypothetical protein